MHQLRRGHVPLLLPRDVRPAGGAAVGGGGGGGETRGRGHKSRDPPFGSGAVVCRARHSPWGTRGASDGVHMVPTAIDESMECIFRLDDLLLLVNRLRCYFSGFLVQEIDIKTIIETMCGTLGAGRGVL